MARPVTVRDRLLHLVGSSEPKPRVVREYGRDSLLVWVNLLVAAIFASTGRRVGLRSDEQLAARMEADAAAMRKKGYLVASVQEFSLPGLAGPTAGAKWYRVTYERSA
jgi:hypothetical protein